MAPYASKNLQSAKAPQRPAAQKSLDIPNSPARRLEPRKDGKETLQDHDLHNKGTFMKHNEAKNDPKEKRGTRNEKEVANKEPASKLQVPKPSNQETQKSTTQEVNGQGKLFLKFNIQQKVPS